MNIRNLDFIGPWSEVKLEIIKKYAYAYSSIMHAQRGFVYYYIDAFAGAGMHLSKQEQTFISGSPINALKIKPRFNEYFFIDINSEKLSILETLAKDIASKSDISENDIHFANKDCNKELIDNIFPKVKYKDYKRALCVLDPYGLHLDWNVIQLAGSLKTIDIFLNFPIMDINMNVLLHDRKKVKPSQIERMDRFWGDTSWQDIAYTGKGDLFGHLEKKTNAEIANEYGERLNTIAGFNCVPDPIAMKNTKEGTVYYLFLASQKDVAATIARDIFKKYSQ